MTKLWATKVTAVDPVTGLLTEYNGPNVREISPKLAHEWCQNNGYGYLKVLDEEVVAEGDYDCFTGKIKNIKHYGDESLN